MPNTQPTDDEILALDQYFQDRGFSVEQSAALDDYSTRVHQAAKAIRHERKADDRSKV